MLINLKDFYPNISENGDVDVPQEVVDFLIKSKKKEVADLRKKYYSKFTFNCPTKSPSLLYAT